MTVRGIMVTSENKEGIGMYYNYHTHTTRCFHAGGEDEEYVEKAIENGEDLTKYLSSEVIKIISKAKA